MFVCTYKKRDVSGRKIAKRILRMEETQKTE